MTGVNGVAGETAHVINSSWGGNSGFGGQSSESHAIDALLSTVNDGIGTARRGLTMVFSAGNDGSGSNTIRSPGNGHNAFVVAALDAYNPGQMPFSRVATYSSRGPQQLAVPFDVGGGSGTLHPQRAHRIDIAAPGSNLYVATSTNNTSYAVNSGTSFAAPLVAGGVALLVNRAIDAYPTKFNDATDGRVIKAVLMNTADKTARWNGGATAGLDPAVGTGRMNLDQARFQYDTGFGFGVNATPAVNSPVVSTGWTRQVSGGNGVSQTYSFQVAAPYTDLSSTLVWFSKPRADRIPRPARRRKGATTTSTCTSNSSRTLTARSSRRDRRCRSTTWPSTSPTSPRRGLVSRARRAGRHPLELRQFDQHRLRPGMGSPPVGSRDIGTDDRHSDHDDAESGHRPGGRTDRDLRHHHDDVPGEHERLRRRAGRHQGNLVAGGTATLNVVAGTTFRSATACSSSPAAR